MTHFHDDDIKKALLDVAPEAKDLINASKFGEIKHSYVVDLRLFLRDLLTMGKSIEESIREDVAFLKASPFIRKDSQIVGLKYNIMTGELSEVDTTKSEL
jgi:carbonic anhydrase